MASSSDLELELDSPNDELELDMGMDCMLPLRRDSDDRLSLTGGWGGMHIQRVDSTEILYKAQKPPKVIGPYVLGSSVGEGSYGKVKEAMHMASLQRVAVKIMKNMRLKKLNNGTGPANARKEIRLLRGLRHRNVIALHEVYYSQEKEKIYVFMEYCAGTLKELLDSAPDLRFPEHQARNYFAQLMTGVEYIHSQGVIHRDIKPGNLLLSNSDEVKISDFGVADELDRYTAAPTCTSGAGTPPFMAPELVNGMDTFDGCKADIWACGVTLWNFTTGGYPFPFRDGSVLALFTSIGKGEYTIPDGTGPVLEALLRGILTVNYEQRFSIEQVVTHEWFATAEAGEHLVLPARDDGQNDLDRGTTLVPFLDRMHSLDDIKANIERRHAARFNLTKDPLSSPRLGFKKYLSSLAARFSGSAAPADRSNTSE